MRPTLNAGWHAKQAFNPEQVLITCRGVPAIPRRSPRTPHPRSPPDESTLIYNLCSELGHDVFTSLFARMELDAVDKGAVRLSAPTGFLRNWIQLHYSEQVLSNWLCPITAARFLSETAVPFPRGSCRGIIQPARHDRGRRITKRNASVPFPFYCRD